MANFFEGIGNLLKHPIDEIKWMADETKGVLKPLLKGDVSESFDSFKGSFGRHNDMMAENITIPLFGHNKLSENPDAAAGAIIGSVFAAPYLASAGQSMFGGTGTGNLGTSDFASGNFGGNSFGNTNFGGNAVSGGNAYKPTTEFGKMSEAYGDLGIDTVGGSDTDWAGIMKSAGKAFEQMGKGGDAKLTGGHRPGFKGVQMPAQQYSAGAMQEQMAAQEWANAGAKPMMDFNAMLNQTR